MARVVAGRTVGSYCSGPGGRVGSLDNRGVSGHRKKWANLGDV